MPEEASPLGRVAHLSLAVRDVDASRRFYRDVLGLREVSASAGIAELSAGDTHVVLLRRDHGALPEGFHFGFRAASRDDVDRWGRRLREGGAHIDSGPSRSEWGAYVIYARDPDGYQIEIWTEHGS